MGSWDSLVIIDSWFTSPWYSNCQNSVIYLGSSFLLFSFYFKLKWKKWNTELESSRVNKESSFAACEVYTRLQFNTGTHEIDSLWPAKKSRSHLQPLVPTWLSLLVFICWGKTNQVAGKRTTFKKDDMKMIEPQTIELEVFTLGISWSLFGFHEPYSDPNQHSLGYLYHLNMLIRSYLPPFGWAALLTT